MITVSLVTNPFAVKGVNGTHDHQCAGVLLNRSPKH